MINSLQSGLDCYSILLFLKKVKYFGLDGFGKVWLWKIPPNKCTDDKRDNCCHYILLFNAALALESTTARAWSTLIPVSASVLPLKRTTSEFGSNGSSTLDKGS